MFRDVLRAAGRQWRAERRLNTLVAATSRNPTQKWTHRISKTVLTRQKMLRAKGAEGRQGAASCHTPRGNNTARNGIHSTSSNGRSRHLTPADVESLRRQQDEAVAEEDARAGSSLRGANARHGSGQTSTSHLRYNRVDEVSGKSIIQQRFDALAYDAVLKYGPPLPAEFVAENDVLSPSRSNVSFNGNANTKGESFCFYDEVSVKPHELFQMIRQLDPSYSVYTHADGVPFSLLLKNCLFFRVWGGRVHFMRCLRQESSDGVVDNTDNSDAGGRITVVLAKYKMREAPSIDGLRQGPQPWLYSYRMV